MNNEIQQQYNSYIVSTLTVLNKMIQKQEQNTVSLFSYLFNKDIDMNERIDLNEKNLIDKLVNLASIEKKIDNLESTINTINVTLKDIANSIVLMVDTIDSSTSELSNISKKYLYSSNNSKKEKNNYVKVFLNKITLTINDIINKYCSNIFYFEYIYLTIEKEINDIIEKRNQQIKRDQERKQRIKEILGHINNK